MYKAVEKQFRNLEILMANINKKISQRSKKIINVILFFLIVVLPWSTAVVGVEQTRFSVRLVTIGLMVLLLLLALVNATDDLPEYKYNKIFIYLWYVMCVLMIIASLVNKNIDKLIVPGGLGLIFPISSLALRSEERRQELFDALSVSLLFSLIIFSIVSIIFVPMTEYQFAGIFANCNYTEQYLTCVLVAMLYKVLKNKKNIIYTIPAGISLVFIWLTSSRTGVLATIFIVIAWGVFYIAGHKKWDLSVKYFLISICTICIVFVAWLNIYVFVNNYFKNSIQEKYSINAEEKIMNERNQTIDDYNYDAQSVFIKSQRRYDMGTVDLNRYSTGRIDIWKQFLINTNLLGHGESVEGISSAHNTFIQFVYDYGAIAGILYLVAMIYLCIILLIRLLKMPTLENCLFAMIAGNYLATSLVASIGMPFGYLPSILFNLVFWNSINKTNS